MAIDPLLARLIAQAEARGGDLVTLQAIAGIDADALSPREALEALYRLKRLAED